MAYHPLLDQLRRSKIRRRTNIDPFSNIDFGKLDWSGYCKKIMASENAADKATQRAEKMAEEAAKKAEKMAEKAERIAKKIANDAEEFVRNRPQPGFHHPHLHYDNHDRRGPAPTTTIYHHYHHGQATATETSTTTITSTSVAISSTTVTYIALTTSTAVETSATAAFLDTAGTPHKESIEDVLGYMVSPGFWILMFLLGINVVTVNIILQPDPKTKSPIRPKQRAPSLAGIQLDLACLKSYIITRSRQFFAVVLCRILIALYFLEGYWFLDTLLRIWGFVLEEVPKVSNTGFAPLMALLIPTILAMWCVIGFLFCLALDQQFTLDGELVMLEVPASASRGPVRNDKKKPRHDGYVSRGQVGMDKLSVESGSEGGWQKDGFS